VTPELEAKLSALLDGELAPEEAAALRAEIARRPELEARLTELAAVDEGLRALPGRPLPAGLRERLAERIRAEGRSDPPATRPMGGARRAPPRTGRRWLGAAALATAAAALALVLLPRLRGDETQLARTQPEPVAPKPAPAPVARPEPDALAEALLDPEAEGVAGDEEGDVAADLPVIAVLDVLAELDELEGSGHG
jgi:anti-sigma factor RsiW